MKTIEQPQSAATAILENVIRLRGDALLLFKNERYGSCLSLSVLAAEELAKFLSLVGMQSLNPSDWHKHTAKQLGTAAFLLTSQKHERTKDTFGEGERLTVEGKAGELKKTVSVTVYDDFPAMAFFDVQYTNTGTSKLAIRSWTNNAYTVNAQPNVGAPAFWSYQSGSYEKRPNWILPLHTNFQQENYQGMNADDYGGGTPIIDVWLCRVCSSQTCRAHRPPGPDGC